MRIIALLLLMAPLGAGAGTIYKCKSDDGVATYQQVPCADAASSQGARAYQEVPDDFSQNWTTQVRGARQSQHRGSTSHSMPVEERPNADGRVRDLADRQSDAGKLYNELSRDKTPSGKRLAAQFASDYVGAGASQAGQPGHDRGDQNGAPQRLRDYQGNTYTQPSGSTFVRDDKTGKQCFRYGDFLECK